MKSSNSKSAAQLIRAEIKAAFPGIKFSVTSDYNSIRIHWTNGPAPKKVTEITNKYKAGHFNGMEDIYEYTNINSDVPTAKYIFDERTVTYEIKNQVIQDLQIPEDEVNTYDGERRLWSALNEISYDAEGRQIVAPEVSMQTVIIDGVKFKALEVATTDEDNGADVKNRWNVFGDQPDERTETGQTGYLAEWFSGKYCFWKVGDHDRVILDLSQVVFNSLPEAINQEFIPFEPVQEAYTPEQVEECYRSNPYSNGREYWHMDDDQTKIVEWAVKKGLMRRLSHTQIEWTHEGSEWAILGGDKFFNEWAEEEATERYADFDQDLKTCIREPKPVVQSVKYGGMNPVQFLRPAEEQKWFALFSQIGNEFLGTIQAATEAEAASIAGRKMAERGNYGEILIIKDIKELEF